MRTGSLLLTLAVSVFTARAIAQEIVIEPTNGRAQTATHISRPAAGQAMPADTGKPAVKPAIKERSATTKSGKKASIRQVVATRKVIVVDTKSSVPAVSDSAKSETPEVIPAAKMMPARPEWAMTDTRNPRGLQSEIAAALARDPKLVGSSIQVNVDEGSVTLEGRVAGIEERLQAQRLAQSYAWNRKLVDHIETVRAISAQK